MRRSVVAVAVLASMPALSPPLAAQPAIGRILVMPFENVSRDSRIVWLGEAASVLIADDLNVLGAGAITRDERREAFERLQVPPAASLTNATMIRIGQLVRATQVVVGTLTMDGDTIVISARSIALEAAKVQADVTERGPLPDLFTIFERVARRKFLVSILRIVSCTLRRVFRDSCTKRTRRWTTCRNCRALPPNYT